MEKRKIEVKNFTTFKSFDDGGKVRIVKNDAGEEIGFELSGTLTKFDYRNENDMTFKSGSYDRFVDDYFISHSLNVPVCLQHNDCDIRNVCGKVKEMTKTESGVDVVVYVPKSANRNEAELDMYGNKITATATMMLDFINKVYDRLKRKKINGQTIYMDNQFWFDIVNVPALQEAQRIEREAAREELKFWQEMKVAMPDKSTEIEHRINDLLNRI